MEPFTRLEAVAAPLMADNIDTDQIIANRDLIRATADGYGARLFARRRYREDGSEDPDFVLNRAPYRDARILLAGANFGCGSSREAAAWALRDFGIRALAAPSYGAIFARNCIVNGILPITLPGDRVAVLAERVEASDGADLVTVDLKQCTIGVAGEPAIAFRIADIYRRMLRDGTDIVSAALGYRPDIDAFEAADRKRRPWARPD